MLILLRAKHITSLVLAVVFKAASNDHYALDKSLSGMTNPDYCLKHCDIDCINNSCLSVQSE